MLYAIIICSIITLIIIFGLINHFKILEKFENIPIFIISLKRAQERRANMVKKMKEIDNKYIIFDAVDGKNMTKYQKNLSTKFEKLTDGEKGCFLSHYLLWKKILESGYETVIIFEDDAEITNDKYFKDDINKFLIPDYDFIHLGFCYEKYTDKIKDLGEFSVYKTDSAMCTHAYLISKNGVKKLLNYLDKHDKWDYPIDHVMDKINNFNKYIVVPQIVKQSGEKSYIRDNFLFFNILK